MTEEVEITAEMIEAGEEAIAERWWDLFNGYSPVDEALREIFLAMYRSRQ